MTTDEVTSWPGISAYLAATQQPSKSFADERLRHATFDVDETAMGQSALVFFPALAADATGGPLAVRCFLRPAPGAAERYRAIAKHLVAHPVPAFSRTEWLQKGIRVEENWYPAVLMERVDGPSLRSYLANNLDDADALLALAERWRTLMAELHAASVAHGDLSSGNIVIRPDGSIRLIDLDAVWVPAAAEWPPAESGHRNFQHPRRIATRQWGRSVDAFSALVIYLSILAVGHDPEIWDVVHNGENLVLSDSDYTAPNRSPIWRRLAANPSIEVRELARLLQGFCEVQNAVDTNLETLLTTREIPGASATPTAAPAAGTGDVWWQDPAPKPAPQLDVDWTTTISNPPTKMPATPTEKPRPPWPPVVVPTPEKATKPGTPSTPPKRPAGAPNRRAAQSDQSFFWVAVFIVVIFVLILIAVANNS